jgi:hypothetical protein
MTNRKLEIIGHRNERDFPHRRGTERDSALPLQPVIWRKWVSLDMRYAVIFLVWLSGVTSSGAETLTPKLRLAQESREQCTNRCDSGYDACVRRCPLSMGRVSCTADCQAQLSTCNNKCIGR